MQFLSTGELVGEKYTVEAFLGSGAMGSVYRVRHEDLGSTFALKLLSVLFDVCVKRVFVPQVTSLRHFFCAALLSFLGIMLTVGARFCAFIRDQNSRIWSDTATV